MTGSTLPDVIVVTKLHHAEGHDPLAAEKSLTLTADNMTCASCPYIVKESLQAVPGVKVVEVNLEAQSATVTYDDAQTSPAVLMKATTDVGCPSQVKS